MTRLADLADSGLVVRERSLASMTTYKLGGAARWFATPNGIDDLKLLARAWCNETDTPMMVLGRGSNIVVADGGFPGLVVKLGPTFSAIEIEDSMVAAGGGTPLPVLARRAVAHGRLGLEWFVGIPGSVGGAVHQNAGCHGAETVDRLIDADVLAFDQPEEVARKDAATLGLRYRHSALRSTDVVISARFATFEGDRRTGEREMRGVTRWRKVHQPGGTLNAGSVFKNPPGDSAGRLIDQAGLKGFSVGGASVSERHANFFVAGADATASDVWNLMRNVRERVALSAGVTLEPEIAFVGSFE